MGTNISLGWPNFAFMKFRAHIMREFNATFTIFLPQFSLYPIFAGDFSEL